jgi:hypothetical protein
MNLHSTIAIDSEAAGKLSGQVQHFINEGKTFRTRSETTMAQFAKRQHFEQAKPAQ